MFVDEYDFGFEAPMPLRWLRSYSSRTCDVDGDLGFGWTHPYQWRIRPRRRTLLVYDDHGKVQIFRKPRASGDVVRNAFNWSLRRNDGGFVLRLDDGRTLHFGVELGGWNYLDAESDRNGNHTWAVRDEKGCLIGLTDSAGRSYRVSRNRAGRIEKIEVETGPGGAGWLAVVGYRYDDHGDLIGVRDAEGYDSEYGYENHLLTRHRSTCGLTYFYRYDGSRADAYCIETWGEYLGQRDPALEHPIDPVPPGQLDHRKVKGINYRRFTYEKEEHYCEVENGLGGITRYFGDERGRVVKDVPADGSGAGAPVRPENRRHRRRVRRLQHRPHI
jgi:YD repeat-containing protein